MIISLVTPHFITRATLYSNLNTEDLFREQQLTNYIGKAKKDQDRKRRKVNQLQQIDFLWILMGALSLSLQFSDCALHLCFGVGDLWRDGEFIILYSFVGSSLAEGPRYPAIVPSGRVCGVLGVCGWCFCLGTLPGWALTFRVSPDHTEVYCSHLKKKKSLLFLNKLLNYLINSE